MVENQIIVDLNDEAYFNTKAKDQFQKRNCILEALKYFKTHLENEILICMYMSYWGNLNLHIDVHEIIFSSPSTFWKYYCSSSLFMPWFNPSLYLTNTHTLFLSCSVVLWSTNSTCFCVRFFLNGLRVLSNIQVFLAFYSWFIPSFSSHLSHTFFYRRCALIFISNLLHCLFFWGSSTSTTSIVL